MNREVKRLIIRIVKQHFFFFKPNTAGFDLDCAGKWSSIEKED